jgi:hypothetical protein
MQPNNRSSQQAFPAIQQECARPLVHTRSESSWSMLSDFVALMQSSTSQNSSNMPAATTVAVIDEYSAAGWLELEQVYAHARYPELSLSCDFSLDLFEAERLAEAGLLVEQDKNRLSIEMMPALGEETTSPALSPESELECPALPTSYSEHSASSDDDNDDGDDEEPNMKRTQVDHPNNKRQKKRSRKAHEPTVKVYVEYKDEDVLCQRGGLSNRHPGNVWYRLAKEALQPKYFTASKSDKTDVSQELVDRVHARGGRFLKKDSSRATAQVSSCWYEVHNHYARTKAGQALREVYTPEKGAAKRVKYNKKQGDEEDDESV